MLLDNTTVNLTLRPMQYPQFFDMYKNAIKNTWTVDEVDFSDDIKDLKSRLSRAEVHMVKRLVAFFATGDNLVAHNVVLNLYKYLNSPEARMYLSRQLFEETVHIQFYLQLLDTYIPDPVEREEMFKAISSIPTIYSKAKWAMDWWSNPTTDPRLFLKNLIVYASCIEGLFFYGAFAYVYFMRSRGLLNGLASGTNWVFRDESVVGGTEILTENDGWVPIEKLESQRVAQFDLATEEISFVEPLHKSFHSANRMVRIAHRKGGVHQVVTPHHDFVQKWDYQDAWSKQKADVWKPNGKKQLAVAGWKHSGRTDLSPVERFLIALQADGSMSPRYDGSRVGHVPAYFDLKKERKILRLRSILADCGFTYHETEGSKGRKHFTVRVPVEVRPTKYFADWVRLGAVSSTWCRAFIEELVEWDGWKYPTSQSSRRHATALYYSSKEKSNTDVVQAVGALCGMHITVTAQEDKRKEAYSTIYRAYIYDKASVLTGTMEKWDAPGGLAYCLNVPSGAFLIRSDNKVSVTGNSMHLEFAYKVVDCIRQENPELFDKDLELEIRKILAEAVELECEFATEMLSTGIPGLTTTDIRQYLQYVVDMRLARLGYTKSYNVRNPFDFMALQDVQELSNFFERRVSAYQTGVTGKVAFDEEF